MLRLILLFALALVAAVGLLIYPRIPLRLLARLGNQILSANFPDRGIPRWISYYTDPFPNENLPEEARRAEDILRMAGVLVLAPLAVVLLVILFN